MAWVSALGSVIEVAIALAGFSGIVAAVGRRANFRSVYFADLNAMSSSIYAQ